MHGSTVTIVHEHSRPQEVTQKRRVFTWGQGRVAGKTQLEIFRGTPPTPYGGVPTSILF